MTEANEKGTHFDDKYGQLSKKCISRKRQVWRNVYGRKMFDYSL